MTLNELVDRIISFHRTTIINFHKEFWRYFSDCVALLNKYITIMIDHAEGLQNQLPSVSYWYYASPVLSYLLEDRLREIKVLKGRVAPATCIIW